MNYDNQDNPFSRMMESLSQEWERVLSEAQNEAVKNEQAETDPDAQWRENINRRLDAIEKHIEQARKESYNQMRTVMATVVMYGAGIDVNEATELVRRQYPDTD